MITTKAFESAFLVKEPFRYSVIPSCLEPEVFKKLIENLPNANYYRSVRHEGSDKNYNVVNNILLKLGDDSYNKDSYLADIWIEFVNQFKSKRYIDLLSVLLEEDLSKCFIEITLKKYGFNDFISAHTDTHNVCATHMIFLNSNWEMQWGGQLCFLDEKMKVIERFLPTIHTSVAFVRSENSWHAVEKIVEPSTERIAVQIAFWNIADRKVLPGRIEKAI
jgi:Rps23 Pro-64 3,4-dihydroxylase Tpa1-like proline 4-hydroxylase